MNIKCIFTDFFFIKGEMVHRLSYRYANAPNKRLPSIYWRRRTVLVRIISHWQPLPQYLLVFFL